MDREIVCHVKKISIEEAKLMQQTHSILAQEGVETEKQEGKVINWWQILCA
jgi:hypothetical protein